MRDLENGTYRKESYVAHIGKCRINRGLPLIDFV